MANYYCSCRTNYFEVKDPDAFKEAMGRFPVEVLFTPADPVYKTPDYYGLLGEDLDGSGWPSYDGEDENFDFYDYVAGFLADDSVAIFIEAGAEKLRYIQGIALAINNKKECESVWLNDIYEKAESLAPSGANITRAEY